MSERSRRVATREGDRVTMFEIFFDLVAGSLICVCVASAHVAHPVAVSEVRPFARR